MSAPAFQPLPGLGLMPRLLTVLACAFLVLPHLVVAMVSFDPSPAAIFPPQDFSFRWYLNAFTRPVFREALALSVMVALGATAVALTAGTLVSYLLVRYRFPGRDFLAALLQMPMMIPEVVLGLGFLILFSQLQWYSSIVNILLAHGVITLPYAVRVITANLQTTSRSLEEAASLLGAGPVRTFLRVTLPTIWPGMVAAAVFAFVVSFDNFTVTAFLVTTRGTLPIEIYSYIRTESDPTIAALSTVLILISLAGLLAIERLIGFGRITQGGGFKG
jgi:putative spermidine/putrescine transport system permease protein